MVKKQCARCGAKKPAGDFAQAKNRPDGLYNYCHVCHRAMSRDYYHQNRAKLLAVSAKRRADPTFRERDRVANKKDYWTNRAYHLHHAKAWLRNNKNRRRHYVAQWNAANVEKVREYRNRYKALKRNASNGDLSAAAWRLIQTAFRGKCVYCGRECRLEQDHVKPVSKGGAHAIHNVVPACRSCNATKLNNAPPPFWWLHHA